MNEVFDSCFLFFRSYHFIPSMNSLVCAWRTAFSGHLIRGRQLGCLLATNFCGELSIWSLFSQRIVTSSSCHFTTFVSEDPLKTVRSSKPNHPYSSPPLLSSFPCLLINTPSSKDNKKVIAAIAKEVGGVEEGPRFPDYCFYSPADKKLVSLNNVRSKSNIVIPDYAVCVGSSHGWLAYIDPRDPALFLTNPLVSPVPPTIRLPHLETLPCSIDTSDAKWASHFIQKFVMTSAPSDSNDCTVMVSVGIDQRLAFCKPGDSSWTTLQVEDRHGLRRPRPSEIAYSSKDQLFYCIDYRSRSKLAAWDLRDPSSPRRLDMDTTIIFDERGRREKYIDSKNYLVVESWSGDVLFVTRDSAAFRDDGTMINRCRGEGFPFRTIGFKVYRLNVLNRSWDYMEDLGGGVLFVGLNQAFDLAAHNFARGVLISNSIYFTDDIDQDGDMGIYLMGYVTVTNLFPSHLHPFNKIEQPPPIWFTPNPRNN